MTKVTFLGAGSTVFARQLITDILLVNGLDQYAVGRLLSRSLSL
jgi:alpha-galactosidase/6-phospho-beta-glucosidase family protein